MVRVFNKHPELLSDPQYNYNRFPRAFEESLLMVLQPNHLFAERLNIKDKYEIDFAIKRTQTGKTLFYAEIEYDASGKVFSKNGEINYDTINILARKAKYFSKDKPAVFVKGTLDYVFVVDGAYILKFGKSNTIPCTFRKWNKPTKTMGDWVKNTVTINDQVIQIDKNHAIESGHLLYGPARTWLQLVKKLFWLEGFYEGA